MLWCAGMRRSCMACGGTCCSGAVRRHCMVAASANSRRAAVCDRSTSSASKVAVVSGISASATIASATTFDEAMSAPTMAIAPAGPRTHAEEDAVVEVAWAVKAIGRAGVWRVVVIAVLANRLNATADADDNLRLCCRRKGKPCEQCCGAEKCFESAHVLTPLRCLRLLELRGMPCCHDEPSGNSATIRNLNPSLDVPHNVGG
jgi:hypothetical protein